MEKSQQRNVTIYSLIAAFGGFVFGLDLMNISGAIRYISALFALDDSQIGRVVGISFLGVVLALLFIGSLCERFGRKPVLIGIALAYALSSLLSAFAVNYDMLVLGRFIGGAAFASITVSAMYIGEIAPATQRGKFVSVNQLMIAIGILLASVINYFLVSNLAQIPLLNTENIWRFMLGAELIANAIWLSLLLLIPESPRWLIKKGRETQAKAILQKIMPSAEAEQTMIDIKASVAQSQSQSHSQSTWTQLKALFQKRMHFVLCIACIYAIVQGGTGMNAILSFAPMVFEQVGMSTEDSFMQTVIMGVVNFSAVFIAIFFVEKLGRRTLTLLGLSLIVLAHFSSYVGFKDSHYQITPEAVIAIERTLENSDMSALEGDANTAEPNSANSSSANSSTANSNSAKKGQANGVELSKLQSLIGLEFDNDVALKAHLATVFTASELPLITGVIINETIVGIKPMAILLGVFVMIAAFSLSIGPILWVVFSEIFPNSVRSVALPVAALVQTLSSWSISELFPWSLSHFGAANVFLMYGGIGFIGLVLMWWLLPETKGKTLEAIEQELTRESQRREQKQHYEWSRN